MFIACILLFNKLYAEVVMDGRVGQLADGQKVPLEDQKFDIKQNYGLTSETNVFHSFRTFDINEGQTAIFRADPSITNVLGRMTGGTKSSIDGTLSIMDESNNKVGASLYLLNPSGFVFGKNATLDLLGSFHASTADRIKLGEEVFYADPDKGPIPLLSVASPSVFGFLEDSKHASIEIQGNTIKNSTFYAPHGQIKVATEEDLTIEDSVLYAPNGQIDISAKNVNLVNLTISDKFLNPIGQSRNEIGNINVTGGKEKGTISIHADDALIAKGYWAIDGEGDGEGQLILTGGIFADDNDLIDISAQKISLTNGFRIKVRNSEDSQDGLIKLTSKDLFIGLTDSEFNAALRVSPVVIKSALDLEDYFNVLSVVDTTSISGTGSKLQITTSNLEIKRGKLQTSVSNEPQTSVSNLTNGKAEGGDIIINADEINLEEGFINTGFEIDSEGQGGNITVNAKNLVSLSNNSVIAASATEKHGKSGDVRLDTPQLDLTDGAAISTHSYLSINDAGSIAIKADTISLIDNSSIFSAALQAGGGNITLDVRDRLVLFNSKITAEAGGEEEGDNGGNLTINARPSNKLNELFTIDNSELLAKAFAGNGGDINIRADKYYISRDTTIDFSSELGLNGQFVLNSVKLSDVLPLSKEKDYLKIDSLPKNRCSISKENQSRFTITARDILPRCPEDLRTQTIRLGNYY